MIAARITAFVCILANLRICDCQTASTGPIIGLNSCRQSMIVLICSTVLPLSVSQFLDVLFLCRNELVKRADQGNGSLPGCPQEPRTASSKSPCCSGRIFSRAASLSSSVSEQIISRNASILSPSKNICSVRQRPIPSAPSSRAFLSVSRCISVCADFHCSVLVSQPMMRPNSPAIVASTVGMIPS